MTYIRIDTEQCKGCHICIDFCPKKIFIKSGKINSRGIDIPIVKEQEKCIKCYNCILYCPDFAIEVSE